VTVGDILGIAAYTTTEAAVEKATFTVDDSLNGDLHANGSTGRWTAAGSVEVNGLMPGAHYNSRKFTGRSNPMSRKSHIFSMFGSSPISPMQKHMSEVQTCVNELIPFFEATLVNDWERAAELQQDISRLEGVADDLKRQLRMNMPSGLMMAMSRIDLLETLNMQDLIANKAKDVAGLMLGRQMAFPDEVGPLMLEFVKRCVDASAQAQTAINELDELVETGFRGREVELVESMIIKLDEIESDTDKMQVAVRARLFAMEQHLSPIDVMFMYRIIEWVGDLADQAQRVGSSLEIMLAR
jgi:predicted phosphate transport protein (TIGR00153 family)